MKRIPHWAIFGIEISSKTNNIEKLLLGFPPLRKIVENKKCAFFSTHTLENFIREEVLHDNFALTRRENRSILTFSSGEQRKALLNYLLETEPDYLVLDNVFDMLDVHSQENLKERLIRLSEKIPVIQIVKRRNNLLPFINDAIRVENGNMSFTGTIQDYFLRFEKEMQIELKESLPSPLEELDMLKNPLIEFKNVSVNYGNHAILNQINWKIDAGDFWQLTGPNGSGKTTLLTMLTGDNPKAYGQDITLFGNKRGTGESIWDIKRKMGYVTPSMTTLFRGWNTVEKMVISGLVDSIGLYRKPTEMQKRIAGDWIRLIGLEEYKHSRFSTLNEGQQCMVLIARAMIKHPPVLILDEPAHGLDDHHASIISALINKIAAEGFTTIIYVSHRKEPGLEPKQIYKLNPNAGGSEGIVL